MSQKVYRHNSVPPQDQKLANIQLWQSKNIIEERVRTIEGLVQTSENLTLERVKEVLSAMAELVDTINSELVTAVIRASGSAGLRIEDDGDNLGLFVKDGGSVGVGTSDPASKLELYSASASPVLTITGAHATDYDPIIAFRTDATPTTKALIAVDSTDDSLHISMGTAVDNDFVMNSSGQVGIGNDSPEYALDVYKYTGSGDKALRVQGGSFLHEASGTNDFRVCHGGTGQEALYANVNAGRVGIGTTTPGSRLTVCGGFEGENLVRFGDQSVAHGMTDVVPTDIYGRMGQLADGYGGLYVLGLSAGTGHAMRIRGVIGTNSPSNPVIVFNAGKKDGAGTGAENLASAEVGFQWRKYDDTALLSIAGGGDIYTETLTDYSGVSTITGWSSFNYKELQYYRLGKMVFVEFQLDGTSNATVATFTVPYAPNSLQYNFAAYGYDNGATAAMCSGALITTNVVTVGFNPNNPWTAANRKFIRGQFIYFIS